MAVIGTAMRAALAAAAVVAVGLPILLLRPGAPPPPVADRDADRAVRFAPPPPLERVFERDLFARAAPDAAPADAPALTGIAGRIGRDAVAFVRTADGDSRRLAIGESVDGWRLESLAIDAALFTRGAERARVALPTGDPEPQ